MVESDFGSQAAARFFLGNRAGLELV
jgi:hypothetical protein